VDEAGVCPNLMTRFREEYYVPEAKKEKARAAQIRRSAVARPYSDRSGTVRTEYFEKSHEKIKKAHKARAAQKRLI